MYLITTHYLPVVVLHVSFPSSVTLRLARLVDALNHRGNTTEMHACYVCRHHYRKAVLFSDVYHFGELYSESSRFQTALFLTYNCSDRMYSFYNTAYVVKTPEHFRLKNYICECFIMNNTVSFRKWVIPIVEVFYTLYTNGVNHIITRSPVFRKGNDSFQLEG